MSSSSLENTNVRLLLELHWLDSVLDFTDQEIHLKKILIHPIEVKILQF